VINQQFRLLFAGQVVRDRDGHGQLEQRPDQGEQGGPADEVAAPGAAKPQGRRALSPYGQGQAGQEQQHQRGEHEVEQDRRDGQRHFDGCQEQQPGTAGRSRRRGKGRRCLPR